MSPYRNRLKTPEEIELGRKRNELSAAQRLQSDLELSYSSLKSEIRSFEQTYEKVLGARIAELEDLEWQLKGLLGTDEAAVESDISGYDEPFAQFHHRTDLLDDDNGTTNESRQKSLKNLYREVAKAIHPDLASDDEERLRRQELMAVANQAYEVGDRSALEEILADRELGPDLLSGMSIALELVRIIRQIARVQQNVHALMRQIDELKATDIYSFKVRVDDALADDVNLLAEMAATVDLDIAKTRRRLAVLQGNGDLSATANGLPFETRLIRFPADRSCGILYERSRGSVDYRDWQRLGNARGVREVFLDKAIRLDVQGNNKSEMRFIDGLQADDLQALFLYDIDDSALVHLAHLSGLKELYLSNTSVSDSGLRHLHALPGLRRLYIYHTAISDSGLMDLASLKGLRYLTCSGTNITEAGLYHFRLAAPGCTAVNFEWRHGK